MTTWPPHVAGDDDYLLALSVQGSNMSGDYTELTRVGHGNFIDLIGVEPDLVATAIEHRGRQALLQLQGQHGGGVQRGGRVWLWFSPTKLPLAHLG